MDKVIYQLHFIYINDINSTQFHIVCSLFVTISIIQIHIFMRIVVAKIFILLYVIIANILIIYEFN